MEVLCILHDSDEYGLVRWPLDELSQAAGVPVKILRELASKGVLKGSDKDLPIFEFSPSHAGKMGQPVTLIAASSGPCWFSSRFVTDEFIRLRRGSSSRFSATEQPSPKAVPNTTPKAVPIPPFGDGASSSSSSSRERARARAKDTHATHEVQQTVKSEPSADPCPHQQIIAEYHRVLPELPRIKSWDSDRQALLRGRWREATERQTIAWWVEFFEYVRRCPFLIGQSQGHGDRDPFLADLEWLVRPKNFRKVIEGKYERRAA